MKICVAGIGGIGGIVGGLLAKKYADISFIARGARKEKVSKEGLSVKSRLWGEFVAKPKIVTDKLGEIETPDVLLICVKSHSLETICKELEPLVGGKTLVIPLMNGVDLAEKVQECLPKATVASGVVYISAHANHDFSIEQLGRDDKVFLGKKGASLELEAKLIKVADFIKEAGIDCKYSKDIEAVIWAKFLLNCAFNVITARYLIAVGGIQNNEKYQKEFRALLEETFAVAIKKGVNISPKLVDEYYKDIIEDSNPEISSYMKHDFEKKCKSEIELFGGHVIKEAKKLGVEVPVTKEFFQAMKAIETKNL